MRPAAAISQKSALLQLTYVRTQLDLPYLSNKIIYSIPPVWIYYKQDGPFSRVLFFSGPAAKLDQKYLVTTVISCSFYEWVIDAGAS